ncbi:hypothetical protein TELCIR_12783, partial [Teladorsagia circumcincta]
VSSFICESARSDIQIIIISLKEEFYNKNFVGIRQSEFELLRVPAPSTEFCIHVTMRSVQTGALLGSILGPLTAMMFEGKNMNAKRLGDSFVNGGTTGAMIGALMGPALTYISLRDMNTLQLYDKCYRLRFACEFGENIIFYLGKRKTKRSKENEEPIALSETQDSIESPVVSSSRESNEKASDKNLGKRVRRRRRKVFSEESRTEVVGSIVDIPNEDRPEKTKEKPPTTTQQDDSGKRVQHESEEIRPGRAAVAATQDLHEGGTRRPGKAAVATTQEMRESEREKLAKVATQEVHESEMEKPAKIAATQEVHEDRARGPGKAAVAATQEVPDIDSEKPVGTQEMRESEHKKQSVAAATQEMPEDESTKRVKITTTHHMLEDESVESGKARTTGVVLENGTANLHKIAETQPTGEEETNVHNVADANVQASESDMPLEVAATPAVEGDEAVEAQKTQKPEWYNFKVARPVFRVPPEKKQHRKKIVKHTKPGSGEKPLRAKAGSGEKIAARKVNSTEKLAVAKSGSAEKLSRSKTGSALKPVIIKTGSAEKAIARNKFEYGNNCGRKVPLLYKVFRLCRCSEEIVLRSFHKAEQKYQKEKEKIWKASDYALKLASAVENHWTSGAMEQ